MTELSLSFNNAAFKIIILEIPSVGVPAICLCGCAYILD